MVQCALCNSLFILFCLVLYVLYYLTLDRERGREETHTQRQRHYWDGTKVWHTSGSMGIVNHLIFSHLLICDNKWFSLASAPTIYSVSQKNPPWELGAIFPKRLGIFQPNFTCLLCVPIYASLRIFIQLSATLTKLCHIKRDHPVHIMCAKCPPSAKTHADIFWHISQTVTNF